MSMSPGEKPKHRDRTSRLDISNHELSSPRSQIITGDQDELKKKRKFANLNVVYIGSGEAEGTSKRAKYEQDSETEPAPPVSKRKKKGDVYIEEQTDHEISRKKKKEKEESHQESEDTRADEKIKKSHKAKKSKSDRRNEEAPDSKIAELDDRSRTKKKKLKKDRGERTLDDGLVEESLSVDSQYADEKKKTRRKDGGEESHGQHGVTKTKYQGGSETTENVNEIEDQAEDMSSVQELLISETQHLRKKKKKKQKDGLEESHSQRGVTKKTYEGSFETTENGNEREEQAEDIISVQELLIFETQHSKKKKKKKKRKDGRQEDGFSEEPISQLKCLNGSEILEQVEGVGQEEKPVKKKKSKVHHQEIDIAADASSSFVLRGEEPSYREVIEDRLKKKKKSKKDPENHPMEGLMEESMTISPGDAIKKKTKRKDGGGLRENGFIEGFVSPQKLSDDQGQVDESTEQTEEPMKKKKKKRKSESHREDDDIAADDVASCIVLHQDIYEMIKRDQKAKKPKSLGLPKESLYSEPVNIIDISSVKKKKKSMKDRLLDDRLVKESTLAEKKTKWEDGGDESQRLEQEGKSVDQAEEHGKKKKKQKKDREERLLDDRLVEDSFTADAQRSKREDGGDEGYRQYEQEGQNMDQAERHGNKKKQKKDHKERLLDDRLVEDSFTTDAQHIKKTKWEDGGDVGQNMDQAERHGKKKKKNRGEHLLDDRLVEDSYTTDAQHTKKSKRKDGGGRGQGHLEQKGESVDQDKARGKKKKQKKDLEERLLDDRLVEDSYTTDAQHTKKSKDGGDGGQGQHEQEGESVDQDESHGKKKKKQKKDREKRLLDDRLAEDSCSVDAKHIKKTKWTDGGDKDQRQHKQEGESVDPEEACGKKKKKQKKDRWEPLQETSDVSSSVGLHTEDPSCSELTGTEDGASQKKKKKSKKHHKDRLLEDVLVEESLTPDVQHTREKAKRRDGGHESHRHHGVSEEFGTQRKRQGGSVKKDQVDENEEVEKLVKKKKKKHKDGRPQEAEDMAADEASSTIGLRGEEPSSSDFTGTEDTQRRLKMEKSNNHHRERLLENGLVEEDREQSHRRPTSASPDQNPETQDERQTTQNEGEKGSATLEANTGKGIEGRPRMLSFVRPQDVALIHEIFPKIKGKHQIKFICCHEMERLKAAKREGIMFRSGQFTVEEDEQIRKNALDFTARFGIESPQMLFHPYLYPEKRKTMLKLKTKYHFRTRLAEGLHRFSFHVYFRGVKLFAPVTIKGRFSSEEVRQLKMYREKFGRNWQAIACALNRDYSSVSMKSTQLREGNRGPWSTEETNRLIAAVKESVIDALRKENNGEEPVMIPKRRLDVGIPWFLVERKVETRVWTSCRFRWYGLMLMRMNNYIHPFGKTLKIKAFIKIIRWLHDKDVKDYGDVKWYELCDHIGNVPSNYMQKTFHRLKQCVQGWRDMRLYGIVKSLYNDTLPDLEQKLSAMEEVDIEPETKDEFLISEIFREFDECGEKYEE